MLNATGWRLAFFSAYALTLLLLGYAACNHQIFADEAFYWLEGQHLDWSYAELPGWTQWLAAFSERFLPDGLFFLRLTSLLAVASLPWLGMGIVGSLGGDRAARYTGGLLLLALPLMGLAGLLAIPDVWVLLFGLLALWCLLKAINSDHSGWYLCLGLTLALGINVHIRFWFIVMIAGLTVLWVCREDRQVVRKLLSLSLPGVVLGLVPVVLFNLQHDFPLLSFQLQDRHPWSFQPQHVWFFITDVLVATPLIFVLCAYTVRVMSKNPSRNIRLVLSLAVLHWLFYAVIGFFTDDLRFSLHWTLYSHALLLLLASTMHRAGKLLTSALITGLVCSWALQVLLIQWSQPGALNQAYQDRFTANSRGWQELAVKTRAVIDQQQPATVITDHFMTLSTLLYHNRDVSTPISVLSHPLNSKHGRETQLQIMGYLPQARLESRDALVVIELTALSLEQQIPYYLRVCEELGGLELIDQLNVDHGLKIYHYFKVTEGRCDLPPIHYAEINKDQLRGWVLVKQHSTMQVAFEAGRNDLTGELITSGLGNNPLFHGLDNTQHELLNFSFEWPLTSGFRGQLRLTNDQYTVYAPVVYRD